MRKTANRRCSWETSRSFPAPEGPSRGRGHFPGRGRRDHHQGAGNQRARGPHEPEPHRLGAKPGGVEIKRLGKAHLVAAQMQHQPGKAEQDQNTGNEDHPALEKMAKAFHMFDAKGVDDITGNRNAHRIHDDRDRHRRQKQHSLVPDRPAIQHRKNVAERHDGEEIAQPRTGLGDLQLEHAEVDDVAFQVDGHAHQLKEIDPQLG